MAFGTSCCFCNGACNHTGPHSYCNNHRPNEAMHPWNPIDPTYWPSGPANGKYDLTTDAIEKIAQRVVEMMKEQGLVAVDTVSGEG